MRELARRRYMNWVGLEKSPGLTGIYLYTHEGVGYLCGVIERSCPMCPRVYFYIPKRKCVLFLNSMLASVFRGIHLYTHDGWGILGGAKGECVAIVYVGILLYTHVSVGYLWGVCRPKKVLQDLTQK